MPRKTRILDRDDEYLFVEAPGDVGGPAILIFAHPENGRAVAPGRSATHQSEHGQWCQIARFDGQALLLAPEPPDGLGDRIRTLLPRYVAARQERVAHAKNPCFFLFVRGQAVHALHGAQPSGLMLKLYRKEADASAALAQLLGTEAGGVADAGTDAMHGAAGSVRSTGELREFLDLRTEEGFAGALLDDQEVIYFCLDAKSLLQFVKVRAAEGDKDLESHILDAQGRWQVYEGDEALEPFVDTECWDRLMVRVFGEVPVVGWSATMPWLAFTRDGEPVRVKDAENGGATMLPLFVEPERAHLFRRAERLGKVTLDPIDQRAELLARLHQRGEYARLRPGDHRARSATLWHDGARIVLDSFSGIWSSVDGREFTRLPDQPPEPVPPSPAASGT